MPSKVIYFNADIIICIENDAVKESTHPFHCPIRMWPERLSIRGIAIIDTLPGRPPRLFNNHTHCSPRTPSVFVSNSPELLHKRNLDDMRFSTSAVLVTMLGWIGAATAHSIQLKAHSRECFHETLHKDDKMTVSFQVGDREFGGSGNLEIDFWVCSVYRVVLSSDMS
jgi:hypothetical protein